MPQKINPIPIFLNDSFGIKMLETAIVEKNKHRKELLNEKEVIKNSNLYPEVEGEIRPYFLEKVWEVKFGNEVKRLEKELRNLTYWYRKAQLPHDEETEWEKLYEHATERVDIRNVVSSLMNVKSLKRNIKCPFHKERTASFKVYEKDNRFVCFGCGVRGSPIDFVMKYKNCDFKEAVTFLGNF